MKLRRERIRYSEARATRDAALSYQTKYDRELHKRVSNRTERALLERILADVGPVERLLDVPSGAGRVSDILARRAGRIYEFDYSREMVRLVRSSARGHEPRVGVATVFNLPFRDRSFDLVVSIRLSHHIPDRDGRHWHVRELLRVSDGHVLLTYFDADSLKNRLRELRRRLGSRKRGKHTLRHSEILDLAREGGFEAAGVWRLSRLFSGHAFLLLRRRGAGSP